MVGKAKSKSRRQREARAGHDARLRDAIEAYRVECAKPPGKLRESLRAIARTHQVCWSTLRRQYAGGVSIAAFNAGKRKLSDVQEHKLVELILMSADQGFGMTHADIHVAATRLLEASAPEALLLGANCVDRLLDHHAASVQTHWSRPLAKVRANAVNEENISHWFTEIVWRFIYAHDEPIIPGNLYACDEGGFSEGFHFSERIVGRRGSKIAYQVGHENREIITTIPTICADGSALQPFIIFKAAKFQSAWRSDNVAGAAYVLCIPSFIL
jgi:hypothetical protein